MCRGCSKGGVSCYSLKKCLEGLLVKEWYTSTVTQIHYNCNGRYFSVATSNGWVGVARSVDSNILEFQLRTSCRVTKSLTAGRRMNRVRKQKACFLLLVEANQHNILGVVTIKLSSLFNFQAVHKPTAMILSLMTVC